MAMLSRIADRVINRPLLIHPTKAEVLLWVLGERIGIDSSAFTPRPEANRFVGQPSGVVTQNGVIELYRATAGVGIISIVGSLVNRGGWIGEDSSGVTSYEGIAAQLDAAMSDPKIRSILLDIESPGGEATGMFDLAAKIREIRQSMPVTAIVNDMAASAAYGIASATDEIIVSPTSIVGSIGVVLAHFDYSQKLEKSGIKPTLIFAGAKKIDGNPYSPLTDAVTADLRDEVNAFYARFLDTVAAGRGDRLSAVAARNTEAGIFLGQHDNPAKDAVKAGLADRVGTLSDAIQSLTRKPARRKGYQGVFMTQQNRQPEADLPGISLEQHTAAIDAARIEARAEGKAEGLAEGRKAASDRLFAIIGSDKIKGKEALALKLAAESPEMSAEKVIEFVAAIPEQAQAPKLPTIAERQNSLILGGPAQQPNAVSSWDKAIARLPKKAAA